MAHIYTLSSFYTCMHVSPGRNIIQLTTGPQGEAGGALFSVLFVFRFFFSLLFLKVDAKFDVAIFHIFIMCILI